MTGQNISSIISQCKYLHRQLLIPDLADPGLEFQKIRFRIQHDENDIIILDKKNKIRVELVEIFFSCLLWSTNCVGKKFLSTHFRRILNLDSLYYSKYSLRSGFFHIPDPDPQL